MNHVYFPSFPEEGKREGGVSFINTGNNSLISFTPRLLPQYFSPSPPPCPPQTQAMKIVSLKNESCLLPLFPLEEGKREGGVSFINTGNNSLISFTPRLLPQYFSPSPPPCPPQTQAMKIISLKNELCLLPLFPLEEGKREGGVSFINTNSNSPSLPNYLKVTFIRGY